MKYLQSPKFRRKTKYTTYLVAGLTIKEKYSD